MSSIEHLTPLKAKKQGVLSRWSILGCVQIRGTPKLSQSQRAVKEATEGPRRRVKDDQFN